MARTLRRDHHHVHIAWRRDGLKVNTEAVREPQNLPRMQIWLDVLLVNLCLGLIRREYMNPVGTLRGLSWRHNQHAIGASLLRAGPIRLQTYNHLVAAVAQILRLRVSLAAVA